MLKVSHGSLPQSFFLSFRGRLKLSASVWTGKKNQLSSSARLSRNPTPESSFITRQPQLRESTESPSSTKGSPGLLLGHRAFSWQIRAAKGSKRGPGSGSNDKKNGSANPQGKRGGFQTPRPKTSSGSTGAAKEAADSGRAGSSASQLESPNARRITNNLTYNLKLLKIFKEYRNRGEEKQSTSYRRPKSDRCRIDDVCEEKFEASGFDSWKQSADSPPPVVLVDGYNVCGEWPRLKKPFMRGDLQEARFRLLDAVLPFAKIHDVKVLVVFDAHHSGRESSAETWNGIDIIFCADKNADSWIEREVKLLRDSGTAQVWVVTSDAAERATVLGSGAFVWSPSYFISEMKSAQKEVSELLLDENRFSTKGKHLESALDNDTRNALNTLRQNLAREEYGLL